MENIPFDLEKFCAGDVAIDLNGREVRFVEYDLDGDILTNTHGCVMRVSVLCGTSKANTWTMKPTAQQVADGDGWIAHDGSDLCPIPGVRAGEWEQEFDRGWGLMRTTAADANDICWENVKRWRMLDGWIPIIDGKCPEVAKDWDGLEVRYFDGELTIYSGSPRLYSYSPIVAIRPRQKAAAAPQEVLPVWVIKEDPQEPAARTPQPAPSINPHKSMREAIDGWGMLIDTERRGEVVSVSNDVLNALRWK